MFKAVVAGGAATLVFVVAAPMVLVTVLVGQARPSVELAAGWDIPTELVPVLIEAGDRARIPWELLAAIASVATDFGRHPPDGQARASIYPVVKPAIEGNGAGLFLVTGSPVDRQDVRATAEWLAGVIRAGLPPDDPLSNAAGPPGLNDAGSSFWTGEVARLPLAIAAVAPRPGDTGDKPGGSGNVRQFAVALLRELDVPPTTTNVDAIVAWAAGEGSCARDNPLDTTQPAPGATPYNTLSGGGHVWNYPTLQEGVLATAETLGNGLYEPILAALRADAGVAAVEQAERSSPWGTVRFGSPTYTAAQCGPDDPAAAASPPPPSPSPPPSDGEPRANIPAAIVARATQYAAIVSAAADAGRPLTPARYVLPVDPSWYRAHPDWFARPHHDFPAVDIPVPSGTAVLAVTDGQVLEADEATGQTSCGHDVVIKGDDGITYTYCHGSQVTVAAGDRVGAGSVIMRSGWSGAVVPAGAAGAHLHFQINVPGLIGPSCPQPALAAWATGQTVDLHQLPITGCM